MDSILQQTYSNIEVILLDDASSDNSLEVLQQYSSDPRVSAPVVNEQNTGSPFRQWVKGIKRAKGSYLWIAESDDYADVHFIERCVTQLEQHAEAAYAFTGAFIIDEHGTLQTIDPDKWSKVQQQKQAALFDGKQYVRRNLYWQNCVYNASGVLFRRESFNKVKDDSWLSMRYCGDWLFWAQLALTGAVVEIHEKLNYYRRHSACATFKSMRDGSNYLESMQVNATIEQQVHIDIYRRWICHGRYYKWIKRMDGTPQRKKELRKAWHRIFKATTGEFFFERINKTICGIFHLRKIELSDRCE
jgi:glycosyltransferase involved in cell wall biosynthesis